MVQQSLQFLLQQGPSNAAKEGTSYRIVTRSFPTYIGNSPRAQLTFSCNQRDSSGLSRSLPLSPRGVPGAGSRQKAQGAREEP